MPNLEGLSAMLQASTQQRASLMMEKAKLERSLFDIKKENLLTTAEENRKREQLKKEEEKAKQAALIKMIGIAIAAIVSGGIAGAAGAGAGVAGSAGGAAGTGMTAAGLGAATGLSSATLAGVPTYAATAAIPASGFAWGPAVAETLGSLGISSPYFSNLQKGKQDAN